MLLMWIADAADRGCVCLAEVRVDHRGLYNTRLALAEAVL